jgi:hypothetical protein
MAYFEDLSDYTYSRTGCRPGTKTVGWLEPGHEFEKMPPTEEFLDLLWEYCKVSVAQMRGIHDCELCVPAKTVLASRGDGLRRLLGTSEIRVFAGDGKIYAAPTLVYHYVSTHRYGPPDEFVRALKDGPRPTSQDYFDQLKKLDLKWNETSCKENLTSFGFKRIGGSVQHVSVEKPVCFDES